MNDGVLDLILKLTNGSKILLVKKIQASLGGKRVTRYCVYWADRGDRPFTTQHAGAPLAFSAFRKFTLHELRMVLRGASIPSIAIWDERAETILGEAKPFKHL